MSKIFVFAIGGTGSRVLRSLTMMLAAGVKVGADEIVPIIIDPDTSNADLTRTVTLMNKYRDIRNKLSFTAENKTQFFRTAINSILSNYTLLIKDTDDKRFQDFIQYPSMSRTNKALVKMLFSDKNLQSSMDVGFKGNPNIGSVVLNQIAYSDDFQTFANQFNDGDKIFIVSSIFGGTGASGFPLLLKTLRTSTHFPNFQLINNAPIGAITILPYFKLEHDEDSEIDSSTFISKAKSALAYYEKNISKNQQIDALYFLADDMKKTYENHEGGSSQQNDAHIIEFLAATAIVDFSLTSLSRDGATENKELGIKDGQGAITFHSFYSGLRDMLYRPLVQFTLMANALTHKLDYYTSAGFAANKHNFEDMYSSPFFSALKDLLHKYLEWLTEMSENSRPLNLFYLDCGDKPFNVVTGVKPKSLMTVIHSNYDLFTDRLNYMSRRCISEGTENKFMEMFFLATQRLVKEKLSN